MLVTGLRSFVIILVFLSISAHTAVATIIYVDADATGGNNGSSWADAFNNLQNTLADAQPGDEIRVAQGVYKPTGYVPPPPPLPLDYSNDQDTAETAGDRKATFQLKNGVDIKGGYAGFGEPNPNARDIEVYETVLSGDLLGNDGPDFANNGDNCYHVVNGSRTDETAVLDGFTITAGNAHASSDYYDRDNNGGGMYNESGSPTLSNCAFRANSASSNGGGIYNNQYSSPTLANCSFTGNSVGYSGGGMANESSSSPSLTNCTFQGNWASSASGMYNNNKSNPTLTNCIFIGNFGGSGSGMYNIENSSPTLVKCLFSSNSANQNGGGMVNYYYSSPTLTDCTFTDNWGGVNGGGMDNLNQCNPVVTNCTFSGNEAYYGGGIYNHIFSSPTVTNCTFTDNRADNSGGGMGNSEQSNPLLSNCTFTSNSAKYNGGAVYNSTSSPTITNCKFGSNSANNGGGISNWSNWFDSPTVRNCIFSRNSAELGGAVFNGDSSPMLANCIFCGNSCSEWGGAMCNFSGSSPTVTNCTFSGNRAGDSGNGMNNRTNSSPTVTNCIFWDGGDEICNNDGSVITITYSNVQGGWPGEGNMDADPCFVDAGYWEDSNSVWVQGDHHLLPVSPCIDAGDNSAVPPSAATDLDGGPRIRGLIVDMGVYESPTILFVDIDAVGVNNGSSWNDAHRYLQDALAAAFYGDEIRVAQGTYRPDKDTIHPGGTDNREATFKLKNGLVIKGGYAGFGETDPNSRDIKLYETILSGDLDEDDAEVAHPEDLSDEPTRSENSYHVVTGSGTDITTVLDGFTITGGNANNTSGGSYPDYQNSGGGMYCSHDGSGQRSNATVINCTFIANSAIDCAGGMYYNTGRPAIANCTFIGNCAMLGGGMYGGDTRAKLSNCTFSGNSAIINGGGILFGCDDQPTLINCTFCGNSAGTNGGGVWNNGSYLGFSMTNCILWGNRDEGGMDESAQIGGDWWRVVNYCCVQGWTGGGTGNIIVDPCFVEPGYWDANGLWVYGDYHLLQTSACINAGDNNSLPADTQDLDGDGNTVEPLPFDIEGNPRVVYDVVDMGAYEFFNTAPIADAGPDQVVECACNTEQGTKATLDGTESSDPDLGVLTYTWTGPFIESPIQGATPTITLEEGCPGEYVITLVVNDGIEDSEPNEVMITVVDTTPPEFEFSVSPTMLWPPNHKMVKITPSWTVSDECDASPYVSLVSIVANEGDDIIGDGHTCDDIQIDDDGSIFVRSERSGPGTGRIYTITYQAVDNCDNVTVRSATVSIPHDFKLLARMGERWLWRNHTGNLPEDLNNDGIVNLKDFAKFAENCIK